MEKQNRRRSGSSNNGFKRNFKESDSERVGKRKRISSPREEKNEEFKSTERKEHFKKRNSDDLPFERKKNFGKSREGSSEKKSFRKNFKNNDSDRRDYEKPRFSKKGGYDKRENNSDRFENNDVERNGEKTDFKRDKFRKKVFKKHDSNEAGDKHYSRKRESDIDKSDRRSRVDEGKKLNFRKRSDEEQGSDRTENRKNYRKEKPDFRKKDSGFDRRDERRGGYNKRFKKDWDNQPESKKRRDDGDSSDRRENYSKRKSYSDGENSSYNKDRYKSERKRYSGDSDGRSMGKRKQYSDNDDMRLNKYISNSGICSRRKADELIEVGAIKVNGKIVTELGTRVKAGDVVEYDGKVLNNERKVYVLLNKPKDFITTTDDPDGRKTVMTLVRNACRERIFPVGRLDRATTGLLLLTNDGELAKKLMHPKYNVRKVYSVELDQPLTHADFAAIEKGVELEDGIAEVDILAYTDESNKRKLGIEIHIGKNRIIRRIFEHLGYKVVKLDRVIYAGITKKDLPRGHWRFLNKEEVNRLSMNQFE